MSNKYTVDIEDEDSLRSYLLQKNCSEINDGFDFEILNGGVSNKTVLVSYADKSYVLKQGLEQLRVADSWYSNPARIQREAQGMQTLNEMLGECQVPSLIFVDQDNHILMMSAVAKPFENLKNILLKGENVENLIVLMAELLAKIHSLSWMSKTLQSQFSSKEFFEELRVEPYFRFCAMQEPRVEKWLQQNILENIDIVNCLVHGDFSPKNILVKNEQLILLDHEVIHFGDFAFDVGFSLTHLFLKSLYLNSKIALRNCHTYLNHYFSRMAEKSLLLDRERALKYFIACLFARVSGKSQIEYIDFDMKIKIKNSLLNIFEDLNERVNEKILDQIFEEIINDENQKG